MDNPTETNGVENEELIVNGTSTESSTINDNDLPKQDINGNPCAKYIKICERQDDFIKEMLLAIGEIVDLENLSNGFSLTELSESSYDYDHVEDKFCNSHPWKTLDLISIQKLMNPFLLLSYELNKCEYRNRLGYVNEKQLFHGTRTTYVENICKNNFNWRLAGTSRGHKFGEGVSFSRDAVYASHYGDRSVMFLSDVIVCNSCSGDSCTKIPPTGYDTTTNAQQSVYVKYNDNEFYPKYLIHY